MKILIKAHVVTAILGWIFFVISAGIVIDEEGSLPGLASLCLAGVATVITAVDLLSVYFARKKELPVLPVISVIFWGIVFIFYGWAMFSQNDPWQGKVVYGVLIFIAIFKIVASVSIFRHTIFLT